MDVPVSRVRALLVAAVLPLAFCARAPPVGAVGPASTSDAVSGVQLDGPAWAIAKAGQRVIVGGGFNYAGSYTGAASAVNATSGARAPGQSLVAGRVNAVVADAAGGYFLGGEFEARDGNGGVHRGIAHVDGNGVLDPGFTAQLAGASVRSLAVDSAAGRLYVGGGALRLQPGDVAAAVLAVDTTTGAAVAEFAPGVFDDQVEELALDPGSGLYVGGRFTHIGSTTARFLARLNPVDGTLDTTWTPTLAAVV